jgi:uncharacterized protein with von Willebrand factor type A (vWA) domain
VYAESQAEADALQTEFLAFVRDKREQGVPVKASRIIDAIQRFKNNIFVHNFLNQ